MDHDLAGAPVPPEESVQRKWSTAAKHHNQEKEAEHHCRFTLILYRKQPFGSVNLKIGNCRFSARQESSHAGHQSQGNQDTTEKLDDTLRHREARGYGFAAQQAKQLLRPMTGEEETKRYAGEGVGNLSGALTQFLHTSSIQA
jgi:hypothetical protein